MRQWHQEIYDAADRLTRELERSADRPVLSGDLRLEFGIIQDRLIVDDEQMVDDEHSVCAEFFRPDTPHVAARRAQRWNEVNRWPSPDPNRPEIIESWNGCPIRTNIPLFDDIEDNFHRCLMLVDWDIEEERGGGGGGGGRAGRARFSLDGGPEHLCWVKMDLPVRTDLSTYNVEPIPRRFHHRFLLYDWRVSLTFSMSKERGSSEVPHSILINSDTITPPGNLLLRSEVLLAAKVLRESMVQVCWIEHATYPAGASTNI
ncbi:hypothetical protein TRIATDRAFT_310718 [Trichoderma atroviride IMI 206040]|uniref:Uncharacterized protein n=1 Tax=Hypocrea atroviridis (strain ATCC 20476 / IMI 206040) TaxID=452589 RepID=G9P0H2_HYPAI|nr:uncharacterized protein TRIATDRAFT_310718 [Trichoderma atroviride IMI 206040]EHK43162.1 hypothetical protein TRIATDRAFT_310718 [Trichoderma atroviride IMI 206040]